MKNKRENYIDIAKAIGIILVVLGHTDFPYIQIIYQFHLPLFFFLSGVVLNDQKVKNIKHYIFQKVKSLYVPFVAFELIFLAGHNFFSYTGFYSDLSKTKVVYESRDFVINFFKIITLGGGEQLAGPLWFLISTLEITIIFAVLLLIFSKITRYYSIILFLMCGLLYYVGCYTSLPRMLSQSLIGMFFYCCGFIYKKYKNKISFSLWMWLASLIIIILSYIYNYVDISQLKITFKLGLMISGLCGCYFVICISKWIEMKKCNFITYCGKNTIYILALHCVAFKIVMLLEISIYNSDRLFLGKFPVYQESNWWCIPLTIFGVLLPLSAKKIVDTIISIRQGGNKRYGK